jgi:hypothetical protein
MSFSPMCDRMPAKPRPQACTVARARLLLGTIGNPVA